MIALPSAPAPAPRRQIFVGTAIASAAMLSLFGGMLALYVRLREQALLTQDRWVPEGVSIELVPANIMLLAFIPIGVFAQWAVYSAKRDDRPHTGTALGLTGVIGLMFINAQAYIYSQAELPANEGTYAVLFYGLTGALMAAAIGGVVFSAITAFRYLGGRVTDREVVSAHALYWYALSAAFALLWFVVYVTK